MTLNRQRRMLIAMRSVFGMAVLAVVAGMLCIGLMPTKGAHPAIKATRALGVGVVGVVKTLDKVNPADVAGSKACLECHKSELTALTKSKHHGSLKTIQGAGGNIPKYASATGIEVGDVLKDSICARCHGTPQGSAGNVRAISGVSCESCHGGAAGDSEWLKFHAKKDVEGRKERYLACDKAGMIRAADLYAIAKNCFECHIVSDEALVNAGHPASKKMELVGWSSGEVRHNFQVDQMANAEAPSLWLSYRGGNAKDRKYKKFVVGTLVDLEVTLNNLTDIPKGNGRKSFAKENAKRLKSMKKVLNNIVKALGDDVPAEIADAQQAINDMGRVSSFNFKSQAKAKTAVPVVAKAAQTFSEKRDGSKLGALAKLVRKAAKPQGVPYSP